MRFFRTFFRRGNMNSLDPFDYKEPKCLLCEGEDFYYPDRDKPQGSIPIRSIIAKLDSVFAKNDLAQAASILSYWLKEAKELKDKRGELEIRSEQIGLYRKLGDKEKGIESVEEGLRLLKELSLSDTVSGATVALNAATTYKAFGFAEKAIPIYEEVEKVYEKNLSPTDPLFAGLYNNEALSFADVGRVDDAEKAYKKAISILDGVAGKQNDIAVSYVNLAHLCDDTEGKEDEAYGYIEKAIEYLDSPDLPHDGYHAFVLSKCLPSIEYFGYFIAKNKLEKRMNEIYERN